MAQRAGTNKEEEHPKLPLTTCTLAGGCRTDFQVEITMDSQWRWVHDARKNMYQNCIKEGTMEWDQTIVEDEETCGTRCAMEGIDAKSYEDTYGVSTYPGGVKLQFVNGQSIGSRLYMMEDETHYKMFKLLNREFTLDIDVSTLECGLNGAVYFVEMEADGGKGMGTNTAGAKYGTGYCDAQCPHDLKFIQGQCNLRDWHQTPTGPVGHYGNCCSHLGGQLRCNCLHGAPLRDIGSVQVRGGRGQQVRGHAFRLHVLWQAPFEGELSVFGRYKGVCDRDGCDYNSYRLGNETFFGKGPQFTIDTSKPVTVVTQFITHDNTDTGDLVEIRRIYVQDGKVIKNSVASNLVSASSGVARGNSITDEFCRAQKKVFDNKDDFAMKGGLKAMGRALGRGMVLVVSLWDDELTKMNWLDSAAPTDNLKRYPLSKPGVQRGPCSTDAGDPQRLRSMYGEAFVKYSSVMVGEIG
eukprot:CAMPEP_0179058146 /NCGR_PEP_ID=MMETSP0796-20121207/24700_1 /TAXON_ID=73915 /ORGANISM="Pyrodinium bahamense, Strain pbaha01" /LENGTH=465 /DNA_ID=CAMNT_0020754889 /DNA_START=90 /DNA_END=1485 /DNA_ORIENTATION=-